jgi:hypothetical protein
MKVFWSWQSDTHGKTGRHFVRQALLGAIGELKEPEDVEEPTERERKDALHLDHDRQGVSGSPDLFRTILEKIEASTVFIADVTPVSTIPARIADDEDIPEKRNMNPNVGIELGYALKALSDRNVLMVLNTYYGDRRFLPFDLAHKAGPITFHLPPDADKRTIQSEATTLKGNLITALRPYLEQQSAVAGGTTSTFNETPTTISQAAYYQANEVLAAFGGEADKVEYAYPDGKGFYLRLIPRTRLSQPMPKSTLMGEIRRTGLYAMWRNPSGLSAPNRYGAIVVEPESVRGGPIKASTQLFGNGEIWGVAPWLLKNNDFGRFVPAQAFEDTFRLTLGRYVEFMSKSLGIAPPYTVVAGAVGLEGLNLVINSTGIDPYGPFYDDGFNMRLVVNDTSSAAIDTILLLIFEELFRLSGYPRPQGFCGFPPPGA